MCPNTPYELPDTTISPGAGCELTLEAVRDRHRVQVDRVAEQGRRMIPAGISDVHQGPGRQRPTDQG
jgi:hypothetical protein